jgi:hypothetical protein
LITYDREVIMRLVGKAALMVIVAVATLTLTPVAGDHDGLKEEEIPAVVLKAFETAYPDAEITGFDKEVEEERILYEIETCQEDVKKDYVYSEDGTLIQIEEEIPLESLPETVVKAVENAHQDCELDEAEMITRGSIVEYEVVVEVGEKEFEILVSSDGKIIASAPAEEEDDDDDHDDDDDDDDDHDDDDDDEGDND